MAFFGAKEHVRWDAGDTVTCGWGPGWTCNEAHDSQRSTLLTSERPWTLPSERPPSPPRPFAASEPWPAQSERAGAACQRFAGERFATDKEPWLFGPVPQLLEISGVGHFLKAHSQLPKLKDQMLAPRACSEPPPLFPSRFSTSSTLHWTPVSQSRIPSRSVSPTRLIAPWQSSRAFRSVSPSLQRERIAAPVLPQALPLRLGTPTLLQHVVVRQDVRAACAKLTASPASSFHRRQYPLRPVARIALASGRVLLHLKLSTKRCPCRLHARQVAPADNSPPAGTFDSRGPTGGSADASPCTVQSFEVETLAPSPFSQKSASTMSEATQRFLSAYQKAGVVDRFAEAAGFGRRAEITQSIVRRHKAIVSALRQEIEALRNGLQDPSKVPTVSRSLHEPVPVVLAPSPREQSKGRLSGVELFENLDEAEMMLKRDSVTELGIVPAVKPRSSLKAQVKNFLDDDDDEAFSSIIDALFVAGPLGRAAEQYKVTYSGHGGAGGFQART
ncbi:unnamed protein product [Effrenium voratum]|nr:unnamed protein product [Effrenium voratum]